MICSHNFCGQVPFYFSIFWDNYQVISIDLSCFETSMEDLSKTIIHGLPILKQFEESSAHSILTPAPNEVPGNQPYGSARCKISPICLVTDVFASHATGEQIKKTISASCKPSNVVYLILCRRCGQQYLRETEWLSHCRINGHSHDIAHRRTNISVVANLMTT